MRETIHANTGNFGLLIAGLLLLVLLLKWVNVLPEYQRGVVFRLGRVLPEAKGPGRSIAWSGSACAR